MPKLVRFWFFGREYATYSEFVGIVWWSTICLIRVASSMCSQGPYLFYSFCEKLGTIDLFPAGHRKLLFHPWIPCINFSITMACCNLIFKVQKQFSAILWVSFSVDYVIELRPFFCELSWLNSFHDDQDINFALSFSWLVKCGLTLICSLIQDPNLIFLIFDIIEEPKYKVGLILELLKNMFMCMKVKEQEGCQFHFILSWCGKRTMQRRLLTSHNKTEWGLTYVTIGKLPKVGDPSSLSFHLSREPIAELLLF